MYRQIESSKKSYGGDNVVDEIRRRLKSNSYMGGNGNAIGEGYFDGQKSGVNKHFEEEFSMFYKIPKRSLDATNNNYRNNHTAIARNLDYDS